MPCWMKCWIGLTESENSKRRKKYVRWRKIVLDESLIASEFLIQHFQACFIQHFILMTSFGMLELRISNDSTKLLVLLNHSK